MEKDSCDEDRVPRELDDLLVRVTRPGRYVGGEFHSRHKPGAAPRIVLSYPDVYEIGIANPGLQIIYAAINDGTPAAAERAYCPWPDMAALMRDRGMPLWTLESFAPVRDADLWGFTLQHELTYTNVLEMLDLAGVPLHAAERGEGDPIVAGGGPCTANPLPLEPFFDAFFVGEVEGRVGELVEALGAPTRAERLDQLARVPGVWSPGSPVPVRRQVFTGFSTSWPVAEPLVPLLEGVHDRAVIEVMRGCTAGCRFCQAGMWYRPVRERPVDVVVEAAARALRSTGCDEVSLISLSSCDYSGVEEAVRRIREAFPKVRVSLPSLRVDSAAVTLGRLGDEQRGSITLAPEAGTQRLRDAINKNVDENAFREAAHAVFASGYSGLKLYFMIGLPGETDEDVRAIATMAVIALREGKAVAPGKAHVSVSVSSYVPKAHTPFERERFAGEESLRARQQLLRSVMPRAVKVSFHDVGSSLVEATLAAGGAAMGGLVEAAWRRGARFDGWREGFALGTWKAAAAELGIELGAAAWSEVDELPWAGIDAGVTPGFLAAEREAAAAGEATADCRFGACADCGVCVDDVRMELAG